MRVGDYVRTENGEITKIKAICEQKWEEPECIYSRVLCEDNEIYEYPKHIKSSPNIIDLIEVGDYVNGYMVENIDAGLNGDIIEIATGTNYFQSPSLYNEDIKSIVTHEQFEQMEYRTGE